MNTMFICGVLTIVISLVIYTMLSSIFDFITWSINTIKKEGVLNWLTILVEKVLFVAILGIMFSVLVIKFEFGTKEFFDIFLIIFMLDTLMDFYCVINCKGEDKNEYKRNN